MRLIPVPTLIFASLLLAGCQLPFLTQSEQGASAAATSSAETSAEEINRLSVESNVEQPTNVEDQIYVVEPGDTLYKIAEKTTGNGRNWPKIARSNDIDRPDSLSVGQNILISAGLFVDPAELPQTAAATRDTESLAIIETQDSEALVSPPGDDAVPAAQPVVDSPVVTDTDTRPQGWLIVAGTYYPREIKTDPGFGTDILLLAAPGSRFRYIDFDKGWYTIETDKGIGYIESSYAQEE